MPDPAPLDAVTADAVRALDGARRAGVLVPSANPVVEPELRLLLPASVRLFAARLPVMPDTTLLERNRRYVESYAPALASFGALKLDAAVVGLTGPSYRLLPDADAALAASLSAAAGTPVQTASGAIAAALRRLGARRLCLLSPYPPWLTAEAAAYWTAAGHEVTQVVKLPDAPGSGTQGAYVLGTADVRRALAVVRAPEADAVVMSGTGMLTLPAMLDVGSALPLPFLSSNLCCAWWLTRQLGEPASPLFSALVPALLP